MTDSTARWGAARTVVIILAAMLLMGVTVSAVAQTGTLAGTVTDAATGTPVEGALVVARGGMGGPHVDGLTGPGHPGGSHGPRHAYTDSSGAYVIDELTAGDYAVACGSPGYAVGRASATIVDGQTTTLDFALEALAFGAVAGAVTDASTGLPIAGARVVLMPPHSGDVRLGSGDDAGEGFWLHAITGADGTYAIDNVPVGDYEARAMSYGYTPAVPVAVTVVEGETAQADFALTPLSFGSLEGHVTDASTGAPIENAIVVAYGRGIGMPSPRGPAEAGEAGRWNFVRTDADGFYRFDELAAGTWRVRAFSWSFLPAESQVEVVADATTQLDFALEPR